MKKIISIALILAMALSFTACGEKIEKKEYKLTATEISDEFKADKTVAGEKYKDTIIEISGEVAQTATNKISLYRKKGDNLIGFIICETSKGDTTNIEEGNIVTIKGEYEKEFAHIYLKNCEIISSQPADEMTVDEWEKSSSEVISSQETSSVTQKPESKPESKVESKQEVQTTPTSQKYILNTQTMKIHKSSCASVKKIKKENSLETSDYDKAIAEGYEPCGNCNPTK